MSVASLLAAGAVMATALAPGPFERPRTLELDPPPGAHPLVWVRKGRTVPIRDQPRGELVERAGKRTPFGSPAVFGVVEERGRWGAISTPAAGNDAIGWVRLDPRRLRAGWTRTSIEIDLSARAAAIVADGEAVRSFPVTVGAPGSETPTGLFAVTDTLKGDLDPAYGCCALATSAIQPRLPSGWLGGNRIAIHGTTGPLGVAASHGCIRASEEDLQALIASVPLGAPVLIRP